MFAVAAGQRLPEKSTDLSTRLLKNISGSLVSPGLPTVAHLPSKAPVHPLPLPKFPSIKAAQTPSSQSLCQALSSGQAPRTQVLPPAQAPALSGHPPGLALLPSAPCQPKVWLSWHPHPFSCRGQLQKPRTELGSHLQPRLSPVSSISSSISHSIRLCFRYLFF